MKKYLLYIIVLVMGAAACNKDNNDTSIFGKTPDERLTPLLADYQSKLVASPYGWVATVFPDPGAGNIDYYFFWFSFTDSNRVTSRWLDLPAFMSSYRLKALQRPELIFDTYSYLHEMSNPEGGTLPNTIPGAGLSSDFEYEIISASADSFILKGKYNGTDMKLTKASKTDSASLRLPGYFLAGNYYEATVRRTLYATTQAAGIIAQVAFEESIYKSVQPTRLANVVSFVYADLGASNWQYQVSFDEATKTITTVTPNAVMASGIMEGSFKVLEKLYDPATGDIYLKTSYTNTAGAERVTEELLTRI